MMERVIGILGGMGPEATLDLYRYIISLTPANKDQDHLKVLIYSNPRIPDRTEAIVGTGESPLPYLIGSAKLLQKAGAGIIAMPCNTAHHFLPEIQKNVKVPILDMIEETSRELCSHFPKVKTAGLLASVGTVRSGVYHRAMSEVDVEVLIPDEVDQQRIQMAILKVKAGAHDKSTQAIFESAGLRLVAAGARALILGCTEVPLAFDADGLDCPSLNATRILAQAAVDWAMGKR
jgi:aspartate racemase